jgi:PAS domain S-box-containing protein
MTANPRRRYILGATSGYAIFAALWIFLSDQLLVSLADVLAIQWLSTAKGLFFVVVTTLLLLIALRGVPMEGSGEPSSSALTAIPMAPSWTRTWGYLFAMVVTLTMLAVRTGIVVSFGERPLLSLFVLPLILSALVGGLGPGLLATLTAALGVAYFVIPPLHSFQIGAPYDLFQWSLLIANGALVSGLSEGLHRLRRQTEVARQLHAVTLASIGDGVVTTDTEGRITFMNHEAERLTGWSNREALGHPLTAVFTILDEETRQPVGNPAAKALAAGQVVGMADHTLLVARDGRERMVQESGAPIRLDADTILGVVLVFRDNTEKDQAEKDLLASMATYRSLFDNTLNSVVHARMLFAQGVAVDLEYLAVNPAFARVTGITHDVVGRRISEVIPGYCRHNPESLLLFGEVARSGKPARWEHYLAALERWFSFSIYSPAPGEVVIVTDNITERKRAEIALRESEERFRKLFTQVPLPLSFINKEGGVEDCNERFVQTFGYSRQEVPNLEAWWRLAYPDAAYRQGVVATWDAAVCHAAREKSDIEPLECQVTCKSGEVRTMVISGVVIGDACLTTFIDVTERKRSEQELRDSLAEKVVLLKEVHHRVKNNLQIVTSLLSLQADQLTSPEAVEALHDTQDRVRSMALLHESLYRSGNLSRIDIPAYIQELCAYLVGSFGPTVTRVRVAERVAAMSLAMEQAVPCGLIINELLSNALKHGFPEGRCGTVMVEFGPDDGQQLILRVKDDGVGLPAGFAATECTTLGLLVVRNLAGQLGGSLAVERPAAGGVAFVVRVPLPKEN